MPVAHAALRPQPRGRTTALALVASFATTWTIAATTASAAASCSPPGQQRSADLARAEHRDGSSEVTEYLAHGAYRVTHCAKNGSLLVSQTVSPILDPDGKVVLVPTERQRPGASVAIVYGDPSEKTWARAFRADRASVKAEIIPPTTPSPDAPAPAAPSVPAPSAGIEPGDVTAPNAKPLRPGRDGGQIARAAVAGDACTNTQHDMWMGWWAARSYGYQVNRSRFNYNDTSVGSIVRGHRNWDTTYNSCGLNDITNLTSAYVGSTANTMHSYPDGLSITDRGNLASVGCAGALACTWNFTDGWGANTETDQRYSDSIAFSNVGAAGAYDFESTSTHESGHSIGLDHANSSDAMSMYYQIRSGTTHARSLAKGDVLGLRARYP